MLIDTSTANCGLHSQFQGIIFTQGLKYKPSLRYSTLLSTSTSTILLHQSTRSTAVSSKHITSWHQLISAEIKLLRYLHLIQLHSIPSTSKKGQCQHSRPAPMLPLNQQKHFNRSYVLSVNALSYSLELHSYR